LPAIPSAWAANGSFTGLQARGGITVDCSWQDGKVTSYEISSSNPCSVKIRVNVEIKEILTENE
jgi:alpha-L-fucosidase 2